MQRTNGTRNEIGIELDREKIERDGLYDYNVLVEYLDTEFGKMGYVRNNAEDYLCYYSDEPNNLLKQVVCYKRVIEQPAICKYLKGWQLVEYKNHDFINPVMVEDCLETLARHGRRLPT